MVNLVLIITLTFIIVVQFPESPKYLYSKERFDEARDALQQIARFNGVQNFKKEQIIFDSEKALMDLNNMDVLTQLDDEEELNEKEKVMAASGAPIISQT